jgi:hypothetical protein
MSKHLSSPSELRDMLASVDTILLDCDGVSPETVDPLVSFLTS